MLNSGGPVKKGAKILLWVGILFACIAMAERKLLTQRCENIIVHIDTEDGTKFVTKSEVISLITKAGSQPILGTKLENLDLAAIEDVVLTNKLVEGVRAERDLANNLVITVTQQKPIARWVAASESDEWKQGAGFYIDDKGNYLPLSNRYSARVLLVSGDFFRTHKSLNTAKLLPYLDFLKHIQADEFWRAQVSHIFVSREGEISFLPTVGDQIVHIGTPENYDAKFKKLKVFYRKVLASDWNRYSKINLKFKDQIVCE